MLIIREEQMNLFERTALDRYKRGLVPHIREHFPKHAGYLGDDGLIEVIEPGIARAGEYGFESQRDLCLFVDLTIMLGAGFDTDPLLPWAAGVLHDLEIQEPRDRMEVLWESTMNYLDEVVGPGGVFPVNAYRTAGWVYLDEIGGAAGGFDVRTRDLLNEIWPEKYDHAGPAAIDSLISGVTATAQGFGVTGARGMAEFAILAFLLGHRFHEDPVYPWVPEILNDEETPDPDERMARLRKVFGGHLEKALQ